MRRMENKSRGFTLLEMMIAMALGLIVLAATVQLFTQALRATFLVSQRAEMQQNGRAAVGLISKDISVAAADLPTGGVQLPTATGTNPIYGCDQIKCYVSGVAPAGIAFPSNHLYGVIPGPGLGMPLSPGGRNTDIITVSYTDNTFALNQYPVTGIAASGNSATLAGPPAGVPPLADPAVGIKVGDLILIKNNIGTALGEVTGLVGSTINFADLDKLHVNQSAAASGNIKAILGGNLANTTLTRLLVITYYLDLPPGPDGVRYTADDMPPRLMRQVNGQTPAPVADNIADLQFSYDIFDEAAGVDTSNLSDAGMSAGKSPNQIRKVNIVSMTARSALHGSQGFQGLDLATSVAVRDMSFRDRYQ
jgi:prepilin-type N-terminal cleavage/methylation domain-containing protein